MCYVHSQKMLRSAAVDRLTSMAVFKRAVDDGSFAAAGVKKPVGG